MANGNNGNNKPQILNINQNIGLDAGTTRTRPSSLGTQIPALGDISYMNRKADEEMPGSGFLSKLRNKMARSRKGGNKEETF